MEERWKKNKKIKSRKERKKLGTKERMREREKWEGERVTEIKKERQY